MEVLSNASLRLLDVGCDLVVWDLEKGDVKFVGVNR